MTRRLVIITGQEGAGKTTIVRALLPHVQPAAALDAEEAGQVNPFRFDDAFKTLLWDNVAAVIRNFWQAGYATVIAGSFVNDYDDYLQFSHRLDDDVDVFIIQVCASKAVRDERRIMRPKPSSKEWRDDVDRWCPEDRTLGEAGTAYHYVRIDNSSLSVSETVDAIRRALPGVFH
jgi:energy-coupling factor transporter ATP-binding protein EcfA2